MKTYTLNQFLCSKQILINKDLTTICIQGLKKSIIQLASKLRSNKSQRVSIYTASTLEFIRLFLASLIAKKTIILLPNALEETLIQFKDEYDIHLSSPNEISVGDKDIVLDETIDDSEQIIFFTSGSTGKPQRVVKQLHNLLSEVEVLELLYSDITKDTYFSSSVSHQHMYGLLFRVLWPLFNHRPLLIQNIMYPEEFSHTNFNNKITFISSPAYLKRLARQKSKLSNNKTCNLFSSGGVLPTDVSTKIKEQYQVNIEEIFGSTETGGIARKLNETWVCLPKVNISKTTDARLLVQGPFFLENEILTNDIIEINGDFSFKLLGRKNRLIKIEEKRLCLNEMETYIRNLDGINDVYLGTIESKSRLIIACILEGNKDFQNQRKLEQVNYLKQEIAKRYERVLVPKIYRVVNKLPYNDQSKITRDSFMEVINES